MCRAGAVLTHGNLIANSAGCSCFVEFSPGDVHISYLPLAHIYERVNTISCTHFGCAIGFYSGDVQKLLDDIAELKPTVFCSVPRLWNRIYDKARASLPGRTRKARSHLTVALHVGQRPRVHVSALSHLLVIAAPKICTERGDACALLPAGGPCCICSYHDCLDCIFCRS
jgi:long-subunit acyl-CoA synthetase (AMP-forming)